MTRTVFAIRDKRSGAFMPLMKRNRGYTQINYWAPTALPRLFASERTAKTALTFYIKGEHHVYSSFHECENWEVKPTARRREDYEIVPMELRYD